MSIPWVRFIFITLLTSSSNVSNLLVPPYLHERQYDYTSIGMLVAITGLASLASRFPAGALYHHERSKQISTVSVSVMALGFLLYPLAPDTLTFALVQIVVGLAGGVATTTNLASYLDSLPPNTARHQAMAYFAGALAAGHTLGNLVGGFSGDLLGFTQAFWLSAAITIGSLVFLWMDPLAPDPAAAGARGNKKKDDGPTLPLRQRITGVLRAFSEPRLVALSLVAFLLNFLHGIVNTFFPLYGLSIGLTLSDIGVLKGVHAFTNTIARPLAGTPVGKLGAMRASVMGLVVLAAFDTLIPFQTWFIMFAIILVGIGLMRAIVLVANTVEVASVDDRKVSRGMISGLYNSSQDLGSLSSPALCGALASMIGLTTMMTVVPIASTIVFLVVVVLTTRQHHETSVSASS